jgi:hypothetical protein
MAIAAPPPPPTPGDGPGANPVPALVIVVLALVFVAISGVLIYTIIQVWPPPAPTDGSQAPTSSAFDYFGFSFTLPAEARIFVVIVASGAVGGAIHSLRSLMWYVGNRNLVWSWVLMYCLLPLIGALLATIFYVVLRGGLLTVQTSSSSLNVYGFAAVGALVGLFSEQAAMKLKDVFTAMFSPAAQGTDHT